MPFLKEPEKGGFKYLNNFTAIMRSWAASKAELLVIILMGFTVFILGGCEKDGDCSSYASTIMKVRFFEKDTTNEFINIETSFESISAVDTDSVFYGINDSLEVFDLPVDPFSDNTIFLFESLDSNSASIFDTLQVTYARRQSFISRNCGVEQTFSELDVGFTTFDSLEVVKDSLLIVNEDNIRIYN